MNVTKPLLAAAAMLLLADCAPIASKSAAMAQNAPAACVLAPDQLKQLGTEIEAGRYGNLHSLLVLHHGRSVFERYFKGADERRGTPVGRVAFTASTLHDTRSVTKSIVGLLLGVALSEGRVRGLDDPVLSYFPQYADLQTPERNRITLRHLVTMTSGLEWDESTRPYGDPNNSETQMDEAADPYRYVLERPIARVPGERWEYTGGDTMLLAGAIERATGMSLPTYAERKLFRPLGITRYEWLRYGNGTTIASSGLRLTPRDMARIGLLVAAGGRWKGRQIVPEAWVRDSSVNHAPISNRPVGIQGYGYHWFVGTARVGQRSFPFSAAVGWGGQRIFVAPSADVVVVLTAGLYKEPRQGEIASEVLLQRVLPAALAGCD